MRRDSMNFQTCLKSWPQNPRNDGKRPQMHVQLAHTSVIAPDSSDIVCWPHQDHLSDHALQMDGWYAWLKGNLAWWLAVDTAEMMPYLCLLKYTHQPQNSHLF